jgi:hypothetical protein
MNKSSRTRRASGIVFYERRTTVTARNDVARAANWSNYLHINLLMMPLIKTTLLCASEVYRNVCGQVSFTSVYYLRRLTQLASHDI